MSSGPPRMLRGLRRRLGMALADVEELSLAEEELREVRAELAAVKAQRAREAVLFVAHRSAWDRERADLVGRLARARAECTFLQMFLAVSRLECRLLALDEGRPR